MTYPFDRDNPPEEPPARTDRLLWMVSFALRAEIPDGQRPTVRTYPDTGR
jgi:hypothetical protein